MPMVNLSTVKEAESYELLPAGDFHLKCLGHEADQTKEKNIVWRVQFQVASGEFAGSPFSDDLIWTEKTMGRIKRALKRLGVDVEKPFDPDKVVLAGGECVCTVLVEEWKNDAKQTSGLQNKVPFAGYYAVNELAPTVFPRGFAAKWRSTEHKPGSPTTAPAAGAATGGGAAEPAKTAASGGSYPTSGSSSGGYPTGSGGAAAGTQAPDLGFDDIPF